MVVFLLSKWASGAVLWCCGALLSGNSRFYFTCACSLGLFSLRETWVRKVGHNGDPPDGVSHGSCGVGFACSSHVWAAAAGCNQVEFILLRPWCPTAMVCRSSLPGVGKWGPKRPIRDRARWATRSPDPRLDPSIRFGSFTHSYISPRAVMCANGYMHFSNSTDMDQLRPTSSSRLRCQCAHHAYCLRSSGVGPAGSSDAARLH